MGGMVGLGLAIRHPQLLRGLMAAHSCALYPEVARAAWDQRIATVAADGIAAIANTVMTRYFHAAFRARSIPKWKRLRALRCWPPTRPVTWAAATRCET
ncbi:hypothetical protein GCM10007320_29460 [Pseudorhodoferax aquiterrae]|uniref:Uncharacterized protein n=1 Tax=Pseudorhodoferax aquiterrae TaxID=747304 RepID=A0ABQ3G430_9BURK|nr:hypothetical protein [Pseudorhodoferax aquiterrae]GHC84894.1 hypothetical protein GCM10007320_29460 [Pseudorhodoferax aquiterrae]